MKRVLIIMPELPGGGAEKVLIDILKNFDYKNYSLTLFLEYKENVYLPEVPSNVEIISLFKRNTLWYQRLHRRLMDHGVYAKYHKLVYAPIIRRKLKEKNFDCIISFMEGAAVKIHSYLAGNAKENISWVHIDLKKKHWSLPFFIDIEDERLAYGKMDKIVFVSDEARKAFNEIFKLNENKNIVIHNLIDSNIISELANSEVVPKSETVTICMVGRLNQQKRYDRALQAFKKLIESGHKAKLRILGTGELESELRRMATELNVSSEIEFLGFKKNPYPYILASDIFLNTSESEGYPLSICEALCLGKPTVATNITGAAEILDNSQYGILAEESADAIYEALKEIIANPNLRNKYSEKAFERAKMFDVNNTMSQIYNLLH